MIHTTNIKTMTFHHDEESDMVTIVNRADKTFHVDVPFVILKEFFANYVRTKKTGKVVNASDDQILGLD